MSTMIPTKNPWRDCGQWALTEVVRLRRRNERLERVATEARLALDRVDGSVGLGEALEALEAPEEPLPPMEHWYVEDTSKAIGVDETISAEELIADFTGYNAENPARPKPSGVV